MLEEDIGINKRAGLQEAVSKVRMTTVHMNLPRQAVAAVQLEPPPEPSWATVPALAVSVDTVVVLDCWVRW